jgi:PAS domain-containing protein
MDSATAPDPSRITRDLRDLRQRVDRARAAAADPGALLQDLETAYEELRAADEEVRAQNDTIDGLVRSREGLRLLQERTLAIVPVPVVLTDRRGTIRTLNAAAAMVMNVRVDRLLGKPIFACFAPDDRPALRRLLGRQAAGGVGREVATVTPRRSAARTVEVAVTNQLALDPEAAVCWLLLTAETRRSQETGGSVISALAALALLPQRVQERREILAEVASVVRATLGGEVSVVLGSPTEPAALAATSTDAQHHDGAQLAAGEGPSVLAYRTGRTVSTDDAGADPRWPRLGEQHGPPHRTVAVPLQVSDETVGVLTVYGGPGRAVPHELVELFAVTAGSVLHEVELVRELDRLEGDMHRALTSRAVIDQAKGILMGAHGIDAVAAWEQLLALSSAQHLKVRDLAQRIVDQASGRG